MVHTWRIVEGNGNPPDTILQTAPLELTHRRLRHLQLRRLRRRDPGVRADLRVPARRADGVRALHLAEDLLRPHCRACTSSSSAPSTPTATSRPVVLLLRLGGRGRRPAGHPAPQRRRPTRAAWASARFEFTGTDNAAVIEGEVAPLTFECRLDSQRVAWTRLREPADLPRPRARASTPSRCGRSTTWATSTRRRPSTAGRSIDDRAPESTIESGPPATTLSTSAVFFFTANEPATFQCALDGGAFEPCTSPRQVTGLAVGPHVFRVLATDAAGLVELLPPSYTWIDPGAARHDGAGHLDRPDLGAACLDLEHVGDLHLLRRRAGRDLRVRPGRPVLQLLQLAGHVREPGGRAAHLPRPRHRRRRQPRPDPGQLRLDDRRAAGADDPDRAGAPARLPDREHERDLHLHLRTRPAPPSSARWTSTGSPSPRAPRP